MHRTKRTRTLSLVHRIREPAPEAASEAASGRPPLLILFHGIGSNELSMASIADVFDPPLLVVNLTPQGITYREFPMMHTATDESLAAAASWLSARL